jgi:hypothetical protein
MLYVQVIVFVLYGCFLDVALQFPATCSFFVPDYDPSVNRKRTCIRCFDQHG